MRNPRVSRAPEPVDSEMLKLVGFRVYCSGDYLGFSQGFKVWSISGDYLGFSQGFKVWLIFLG